MALPTTVTELQSFLGAMGFVRTFMPHCSQVSHVLERLTGCLTRREAQRTPAQWTKAAVLAFLKIKHKLIEFAYNYIIDPEAPLFIYADSRLTAIGAALSQEIKGVLLPVGFVSKSSPTGSYPDESRRESVSDRLFPQAGRRLRSPGRWYDFIMY